MGKKFKAIVTSLGVGLTLAFTSLTAWASFFTDYSASGSWASAKTQIAESVGQTGQTLWSMVYTAYKVGIVILQENAVLFIVIAMFIALISAIAWRKRVRRMAGVKV